MRLGVPAVASGARSIRGTSNRRDFRRSHRNGFEPRYLETGTFGFHKIYGRLTWYIYRRFGPVFVPNLIFENGPFEVDNPNPRIFGSACWFFFAIFELRSFRTTQITPEVEKIKSANFKCFQYIIPKWSQFFMAIAPQTKKRPMKHWNFDVTLFYLGSSSYSM